MAVPLVAGAIWAWNGYRAWRLAQAGATLLTAQRTVATARTLAQVLSRTRMMGCKEGCDDPDCDKMQHLSGADALMNDLCRMACECMLNRQGAKTFQKCVEKKLRDKSYGTNGSARNPSQNGPHPEVSYRDGQPVMSGSSPGNFSNAAAVAGAARPDISVFEGGKLSRIIEMKFPNDTSTPMQRAGAYRDIARANGLNPDRAVSNLDVGKDCVTP